jgi:uncharacterized protein
MTNLLAILALQLLIPVAITLVLTRDRLWRSVRLMLLFILAFVINALALRLVEFVPSAAFKPLLGINLNWNWEGKLVAVLATIALYFLLRSHFKDHDFFTFKQNRQGLRPALIYAAIPVILAIVSMFLLGSAVPYTLETLLFQLTMPGLDEEPLYRGILLGLLMAALARPLPGSNTPISSGTWPAIITAILFGMIHALRLNADWSVRFDALYFLNSAAAGWCWAKCCLHSRSLVLPICSHNLTNALGYLTLALKSGG